MIRKIQKAMSPLYFLFKPQQRWLTKQFRHTWMDKDEIISKTLFGTVVHWVEVEGKSDRETSWDKDLKAGYVSKEYVKNKQKTEDRLTEIYLWHTHDRNIKEREINALLDDEFDKFLELNLSIDDKTAPKRQKTYKKIKELRDTIAKQDKEYMKQIVEYCDHMWT
jgi:hypothetical protein